MGKFPFSFLINTCFLVNISYVSLAEVLSSWKESLKKGLSYLYSTGFCLENDASRILEYERFIVTIFCMPLLIKKKLTFSFRSNSLLNDEFVPF